MLQVPKIRQLPFSNKNSEDQEITFLQWLSSHKEMLARLLGGHLGPHLDFFLLQFPGDFNDISPPFPHSSVLS